MKGAAHMKNLIKLLILTLIISACSFASLSRLYVGELDAQFMAGVDTRIDFGLFFIGGDVRTIIRKAVVNEEEKVVGFMPDRTDYKTSVGLAIGDTEIEYAHTCYHRVISSANLAFYQNNLNPEDTNIVSVRVKF